VLAFPRRGFIRYTKLQSNYDKREGGLFHLEFSSGQEMCSLASKTYALKVLVLKNSPVKVITKEGYIILGIFAKGVLKNKRSASSVNKGFKLQGNKLLTYKQIKFGFSSFYVKREVCNAGMHTKPLKMVLVPRKKCSK
jgi:hypothetical protein